MRYPRTRYCIRLPKVLIAELRKQGSPNQQLGQLIDSFDWNSLNFVPDIDFDGVKLEQITVQTSIAGKTALVDHCRFSGKEQRLAIVQAIASVYILAAGLAVSVCGANIRPERESSQGQLRKTRQGKKQKT